MKQLHQKIDIRKHSIQQKKQHLARDYEAAKNRLKSPQGLRLAAVGGFVIGFLLLPKKIRLIRKVLKAYTMAATVRGIFDLFPHSAVKDHKNK